MENNYHYYSFCDYLINEVANELYGLFEDNQEGVLVTKHWLMTQLSNLMGFKSARASSLFLLYQEIEKIKDKVRIKTDNHHVLERLEELKNALKDYQEKENIEID